MPRMTVRMNIKAPEAKEVELEVIAMRGTRRRARRVAMAGSNICLFLQADTLIGTSLPTQSEQLKMKMIKTGYHPFEKLLLNRTSSATTPGKTLRVAP